MKNVLGNIAASAAGAVGTEYARQIVGERIAPNLSWPIIDAAMLAAGVFAASRGGMVGKAGYGVALNGALHLIGRFSPLDVNFNG